MSAYLNIFSTNDANAKQIDDLNLDISYQQTQIRVQEFFHQINFFSTGNNGYIWIHSDEESTGGFAQNLSVVSKSERLIVARIRNCILALAQHGLMLWDTSLTYAYDASLKFQPQELLKDEVMSEVVAITRQQLEMQ